MIVHKVSSGKAPFRSIGGDKVSYAGPTALDRLRKHATNLLVERSCSSLGHAIGAPMRMKPGSKQHFVGIDVPDAGKELLVQQERFQPHAARP